MEYKLWFVFKTALFTTSTPTHAHILNKLLRRKASSYFLFTHNHEGALCHSRPLSNAICRHTAWSRALSIYRRFSEAMCLKLILVMFALLFCCRFPRGFLTRNLHLSHGHMSSQELQRVLDSSCISPCLLYISLRPSVCLYICCVWSFGQCVRICLKFQVLTAASTNIAVCWVVASRSLVEIYQCFVSACCLRQHSGGGGSRNLWNVVRTFARVHEANVPEDNLLY